VNIHEENIKKRCEKQYLFLNLILLWTLWDNSFRWYSQKHSKSSNERWSDLCSVHGHGYWMLLLCIPVMSGLHMVLISLFW